MAKSVKLIVSTSLALFIASMAMNFALLVYGAGQAKAAPLHQMIISNFTTFQEAYLIISKYFIDEKKLEPKEMIYGAVSGLVKSLDDPYSVFMTPDYLKSFTSDTMGSFGGLGIIVSERNQRIVVVSPIRGTPAFREGLHPGDIIVRVDGKSIQGESLQEVIGKLKGKIGTKVVVDIFRNGETKLLPFTITRAKIEQPSLEHNLNTESGVGYILISNFSQTTGQTIDKIVGDMEKQGLTSLILDVRGNPGGLLDAAVQVGRVFLGKKTIVSTRYRFGEPTVYNSFSESHRKVPLILLINEGSASASEILAGAIKDNNRGILLGQKSFGKGSVQTVRNLSDGSALKITTGYYYTPSGICIHKKGIKPNITVEQERLTLEQVKEYRKRINDLNEDEYKEGSVEGGASRTISKEKFSMMLEYDTQLERAVHLLKAASLFEKAVSETTN
jgi:carboxyl-terminal processing protease